MKSGNRQQAIRNSKGKCRFIARLSADRFDWLTHASPADRLVFLRKPHQWGIRGSRDNWEAQAATGETDRPNRQEMAGNRFSCSILRGVRQADSATTRTNEKGLGELPPSPEDVPEAANPRGAEDSSCSRGRLAHSLLFTHFTSGMCVGKLLRCPKPVKIVSWGQRGVMTATYPVRDSKNATETKIQKPNGRKCR